MAKQRKINLEEFLARRRSQGQGPSGPVLVLPSGKEVRLPAVPPPAFLAAAFAVEAAPTDPQANADFLRAVTAWLGFDVLLELGDDSALIGELISELYDPESSASAGSSQSTPRPSKRTSGGSTASPSPTRSRARTTR